MTSRACPVCGVSLAGFRPQARYCSGACRAEASRLRRLLDGAPVDGFASVQDWMLRLREETAQEVCEAPPKTRSHEPAMSPSPQTSVVPERSETRTDRARRFVFDCCREDPGATTSARRVYLAYLRWAGEHEGDGPLSRSAFDRVVEQWAPIEGKARVPAAGRGRPGLAFVGITLARRRQEA